MSETNFLMRLIKSAFGWKPWKRPGSRRREITTRAVLFVSIALLIEAAVSTLRGAPSTSAVLAIALSTASLTYFLYQLIYIPLQTTQSFQMDARRLVRDAMISALFVITAFALIYRLGGIKGPDAANALDYVYFSTVTFSTLGYGDFQPTSTGIRLVAAVQALIGNLHLALIVAAIFLRLSRRKPEKIS